MTKPFSNLREKMSRESQMRADRKAESEMSELTNERVAEALGWMLCERGDDGTRFWRKMPSWTDYYGPLPDWLHSNELAVRDLLPVLLKAYPFTNISFTDEEVIVLLYRRHDSRARGRAVKPTLSEALCEALCQKG
jgi:hypothetical protein